MVGLDQLISGFESVGGSVGLIVGSSDGDFFFFFFFFSMGLLLVLVLV